MLTSLLFFLFAASQAQELLPGIESNRFGFNFNLCPPQLPPKIIYLPAPCRFDAEQEEIRLALARLDANMGQNQVSPATEPMQSNTLGDGLYDISSGRRGTLSPSKWRRL